MDYLNKVKGWAKSIADVGVSFIALGIVLEILFDPFSFKTPYYLYLLIQKLLPSVLQQT